MSGQPWLSHMRPRDKCISFSDEKYLSVTKKKQLPKSFHTLTHEKLFHFKKKKQGLTTSPWLAWELLHRPG